MNPPRLLVTAGPSREHLDDVRFLSNASSGRMGIAVAAAAARRRWMVHLALGPTSLKAPDEVHVHPFLSAQDLERLAIELWPEVDALVATAAVCDYRPKRRLPGKRKKGTDDWSLELVRTPDVLAGRAREKGDRVLVGFALEAERDHAEARRKLAEKKLDLILLNTAANLGTGVGDYDWIEPTGPPRTYRAIGKVELAERIVEFLGRRIAPEKSGKPRQARGTSE